jgi:hypothetical protein
MNLLRSPPSVPFHCQIDNDGLSRFFHTALILLLLLVGNAVTCFGQNKCFTFCNTWPRRKLDARRAFTPPTNISSSCILR